MASQRFTTLLLTRSPAWAAAVAVGLYGVLAYGVAQRAHEFGVRFALGANAWQIARAVLSGAFAVVGVGLLIGIAAPSRRRVMTSALEFVQAPGVATYASVAVVFFLIAAICGLAPARRAARADPLQALRAN